MAVNLCLTGKATGEVADELGITVDLVNRWRREHQQYREGSFSELLKRNNLSLQDFDFYEIHEAFTGQLLSTLKAWESNEFAKEVLARNKALGSIDRAKLNTRGGSVAIGHPFASTGTRILAGASN